jgi:hypothetical protein
VREDGRIVGGEEWQEKYMTEGMEEAPEHIRESSHSAHGNGTVYITTVSLYIFHTAACFDISISSWSSTAVPC